MKNLLPGLVALSLLAVACGVQSELKDWQFSKDGEQWEAVTVPHSYRLPALRGRGPGGGSVPGRHAPEGP